MTDSFSRKLEEWAILLAAFRANRGMGYAWAHSLGEDTPFDGYTIGVDLDVKSHNNEQLAIDISHVHAERPTLERAYVQKGLNYSDIFTTHPRKLGRINQRRLDGWLVGQLDRLLCQSPMEESECRGIVGLVKSDEVSVAPTKAEDPEEIAVWRSVFDSLYPGQTGGTFGLVDVASNPYLPDKARLPSTLRALRLDEAFAELAAKDSKPVLVRRESIGLTSPTMISRQFYERFGWSDARQFYRNNPHCRGVISLGRVGFSGAGQAVTTLQMDYLLQGVKVRPHYWVLLLKREHSWRVTFRVDLVERRNCLQR